MRDYYVYIMMNSDHSVLYIGVTNNLERRIQEHASGDIDGFTKKYRCTRLAYYEHGGSAHGAIEREKQLKGWTRKKKNNLIIKQNPLWIDLSAEWNI